MDTQGISKPLRQIALLPKLIKPSAHYFMKALYCWLIMMDFGMSACYSPNLQKNQE